MGKPIWPKSSPARVDRSLSAHSVMGLVLSAILYVVCVSGTLAVFEDEFGWWERPAMPMVTEVTPEAAQMAAQQVMAAQPDTTHLYLYMPRDNWPRFVAGGDDGIETMNAAGEPVGDYESPWNSFLIELHYYLSLPHSFGMIIVAITGVMLLAMTVSGLLAHPRIFRDAFRLKRAGQPRLVQADLHNRLSVWTAPFHIAVAATGAMIGLFVVVALVLAQTSYDGDTRALSNSIFGEEGEPDMTPADLPDVSAALSAFLEQDHGHHPFMIIVHDPMTAGQHVEVFADHENRLIYGETYEFTADGAYVGHGGYSDGELGRQMAYSVYRLHFGDFGGVAMKLAYFVLGVILCMIIASGLNIYFLKRAEQGKPQPRLAASWSACVWGVPALMVIALGLALLGAGMAMMTAMFWLGLVGLAVAGLVLKDPVMIGMWIRRATGAVMILTGIGHGILAPEGLGNLYVAGCNTALVLGGSMLLFWSFVQNMLTAPRHQTQPAE